MGIKHQDDILALIARNLAGIADSNETAHLNEWIKSSADNKQYFEQVRNIWDASDKQTDPKKINTIEALERVIGRIPERAADRTFWHYWQKIAAVLILPLAIGAILWIYLNSYRIISSNDIVYNEIYTAFGTRTSLRLADSTLVWLNSGSSLKYPNKFNTKNRTVFLKGEAYFEAESDVSRPFIVQTSTLQVRAEGTKFNVFEYDSGTESEVTLVTGKVSVIGNLESGSQLISDMNAGQHLEYNKQTGKTSLTSEDTYKYIAWKDGKMIFRNEPLSLVVNKIAIIFNVDIELQGKELQDYRYHATFQEESLEEILKLLKLSAPIDYKEVKRKPLPDGSFPKKKVIIYQAKTNNILTQSDY
jgi:ferric-dicitrate binding protein FerR (iron transport regulator)